MKNSTKWEQPKSCRSRHCGATKRCACLNPACPYYGITDETIHARVRHTSRGKDRDIPYLRCQCCQTVFTSRKDTPLYDLKAKPRTPAMALGVTDRVLTVGDILRLPLIPAAALP